MRVKAEGRRRVRWCFAALRENLCVIVRTGILRCSLIYCECRARGSPHNQRQRGVDEGEWQLLNELRSGERKRAMAFTEEKSLKRGGVMEAEKGSEDGPGPVDEIKTPKPQVPSKQSQNHSVTQKHIFKSFLK